MKGYGFIRQNIPEFIFGGLFLLFAFRLNLQFLEGANINHFIAGHDEYLTIREVYSILEPASFKNWFLALIGGDILYYGRVVFYTDALIAWLPYEIWGIDGLVMAVRMSSAIWILVALLVLGKTFIEKDLKARAVWYLGAATLHYTLYFLSMPKPEPLQLVFLSLFFRGLYLSGELKLGKHYFWLGLAFAAKINVLVLLPFLGFVPLLTHPKGVSFMMLRDALKSLLFFLCGFFVGIPCLLLTPIKPIYLQTYLKDTVFGTKKTYDDPNLGIVDWIQDGLGQEYLYNHWLGYLFLLLVLLVIVDTTVRLAGKRQFDVSWVSAVAGMLLLMSILLLTERLWPHYLWTGYILCWFALVRYAAIHRNSLSFRKYSFVFFTLLFFCWPAFTVFSKTIPDYLTRASLPEMIEASESAHDLYGYLHKNYQKKRIGIDAGIQYPYEYFLEASACRNAAATTTDSCKCTANIVEWYTDDPHLIWEKSDVVVFNKYHPPLLRSLPTSRGAKITNDSIYSLFIKNTMTTMHTETHSMTSIFELDTIIRGNHIYTRTR